MTDFSPDPMFAVSNAVVPIILGAEKLFASFIARFPENAVSFVPLVSAPASDLPVVNFASTVILVSCGTKVSNCGITVSKIFVLRLNSAPPTKPVAVAVVSKYY